MQWEWEPEREPRPDVMALVHCCVLGRGAPSVCGVLINIYWTSGIPCTHACRLRYRAQRVNDGNQGSPQGGGGGLAQEAVLSESTC